ncbi:MAG: FAD-binding oxidoreductase [Dehalococcoidia bacterium]|jgi:glycolate oxidase FAD binding subunit
MSDNGTLKAIRTAAPKADIAPRRRLPDYVVDGLTPQVAVSPRNAEETAAILAAAARCEAVVIPWGGGTSMATGATPLRYDVALDLTRMNAIVQYVPDDLTVAVQAGTRLQDLQQHLAKRGQYLPLDPPLPNRATIGGIIASNAGGPARHAHGWPRDWLLGLKIALPDGSVVKSGGRVVKNVAGYDMTKLLTGSFGSLGVIVEAAFKVMPLPPARATVAAFFPSASAAARAALRLNARNLRVEALDVLNHEAAAAALPPGIDYPGGACLLVAAAGNSSAVERTLYETKEIRNDDNAGGTSLSPEQAEATWQQVRALSAQTADAALLLRVAVLPSHAALFLESAESIAAERAPTVRVDARPALGVVRCCLDGALNERAERLVRDLRGLAQKYGGDLVVEQCAVDMKSRIDVWGRSDAGGLMKSIKNALDPLATLNRGRFVGGL